MMSKLGPAQPGDQPASVKTFLLGLLIGVILTVMLGLALPTTVSPGDYLESVMESIFPPPNNDKFLSDNASEAGVRQTESGLQYKVIKAGEGESPIATDTALVKYEGSLRDGTVFDQNDQTPMPVSGVVPGFSEALQLMQKGGEYRIWIPSKLGYGDVSPGPDLPANSLLIFDVTLLDFISQEQMQELQQQMEQQGGPPVAPLPGG